MTSIKKQKKILKLKEKLLLIEQHNLEIEKQLSDVGQSSEKALCIDILSQYIEPLIHIDTMLCQSASMAKSHYPSDAEHLLKIIANQHIGVESLLKKLGVECRRSAEGVPFDPEVMEADLQMAFTSDQKKDGLVADSVTPAFYYSGECRVCETVKLYKYQED